MAAPLTPLRIINSYLEEVNRYKNHTLAEGSVHHSGVSKERRRVSKGNGDAGTLSNTFKMGSKAPSGVPMEKMLDSELTDPITPLQLKHMRDVLDVGSSIDITCVVVAKSMFGR